MKKISIDKKYSITLSKLSPEDVKSIILALLEEKISGLNTQSQLLAEIIYNDNLRLSQVRKKAREEALKNNAEYPLIEPDKISLNYPGFEEKPITNNLLQKQQKQQNEQNEQNEQKQQNEQISSPTPPTLRTDNNINNNKQTTATAQGGAVKEKNIFLQHLDFCGRVRVRTSEERNFLRDFFVPIESYMNESIYTKSRVCFLFEIVDTVIEILEAFQKVKILKFNKCSIAKKDIAQILVRVKYEDLNPIMESLRVNTKLRNRPYYILTSLIKNLNIKKEE